LGCHSAASSFTRTIAGRADYTPARIVTGRPFRLGRGPWEDSSIVKPSRLLPSIAACALGCVLLVSAATSQARPAALEGYPRLGIYGTNLGDGQPFYDAPADSTLDPATLDQYALYDQVILSVNPITPYRPDILEQLRLRHPGIRVLGYITGCEIWPAGDVDSLHHFPTRYRRLVRDLGGFLYNSVDGSEFAHCNVNLARRDAGGRYIMAEQMADLFHDAVAATGQWDGIFLDEFCNDILWMQDGTHQFDYVRAGYPTLASFLAAWAVGCDTLANRVRRLAGPDFQIVGNCGVSAHQQVFNGWMREDFPFQRGGTWFDNMLLDPHGYLADDGDYVQPPSNYLFTARSGGQGTQYDATNRRKVRFGLASAALGEGYAVFGPASGALEADPFYRYWYDEYAVDIVSGQSKKTLPYTHWLGQSLGPPYQMVWVGTNPDGCSNPGFETSVTTGWSFGRFAPAVASLSRDTTTSAVGRACAHVNITSPGVYAWDVNLTSSTPMLLSAGVRYSATFWARASAPRVVPVVATLAGGGEVASQNVALGTQWKQYQVVLTPTQSASAALEFFLGTQAGEVWFDDVHFQAGETSLWRRDFENGIVLVNPGNVPLQVPLQGSFRHILGTVDPVVNNGSVATSATVAPSDAVFLIGSPTDGVPPGPIRDARITP
jgi:hypothetical protein